MYLDSRYGMGEDRMGWLGWKQMGKDEMKRDGKGLMRFDGTK